MKTPVVCLALLAALLGLSQAASGQPNPALQAVMQMQAATLSMVQNGNPAAAAATGSGCGKGVVGGGVAVVTDAKGNAHLKEWHCNGNGRKTRKLMQYWPYYNGGGGSAAASSAAAASGGWGGSAAASSAAAASGWGGSAAASSAAAASGGGYNGGGWCRWCRWGGRRLQQYAAASATAVAGNGGWWPNYGWSNWGCQWGWCGKKK